jgi:hypothetical protein
VVALRKRERHVKKLRELAAEFGFTPPLIEDPCSVETPVMPTPTMPTPKDAPRPTILAVDPKVRFNDPNWPAPTSSPETPPVRPPWRQTWDKT